MIRLFLCLIALTGPAFADTIVSARYTDPTTRYAHGILGDGIEWGGLELALTSGKHVQITLSVSRVFEDLKPRLADLDNDGMPEVIVIETHVDQGAQLAIYGIKGKIAATPHIGRSNRWLAPIGAADLDGDGRMEIAYIDRPHLAKTLRVWRYEDDKLSHIADLQGLTNHRIGENYISGGIRYCANGPEMITASADWSDVMMTTLVDGKLLTRSIGQYRDRASFSDALICQY